MTLTNKCDLEEVKHQLCQEALALIETDAEWREVDVSWGFSYQCGKFRVSDTHYFKSLLCRTREGYEVINSSFFPMFLGQGFEDGFDRMMEKYKNAPATILLEHARQKIREKQDQEKCRALTDALVSDQMAGNPVFTRKPWWRFW